MLSRSEVPFGIKAGNDVSDEILSNYDDIKYISDDISTKVGDNDWCTLHQNSINTIKQSNRFVPGGFLKSAYTSNKKSTLQRHFNSPQEIHQSESKSCKIEEDQSVRCSSRSDVVVKNDQINLSECRKLDSSVCDDNKYDEFGVLEVVKNSQLIGRYDLMSVKLKKYILGRADYANIRTDHPSCSRLHAIVTREEVGENFDRSGIKCLKFHLQDTNSVHGTFLNGGRLATGKNYVLEHDDEIQLGFSSKTYIFKWIKFKEDGKKEITSNLDKIKINEYKSGVYHKLDDRILKTSFNDEEKGKRRKVSLEKAENCYNLQNETETGVVLN